MKKIRIVIADSNISYLESLATFMRTSEERSRFIVTYFSNSKKLTSYINQDNTIDILLISPELHDSKLPIASETTLIYLEDDVLSEGQKWEHTVYRYQRLNQLVSNLLAIYYENNKTAGRLLARSKQTRVIAVYSPTGGAGATTVATTMSKQLALNSKKVFYLNLETFNTTSLYFSSDQDNPSLQIFYYVKANSNQLLSKIEGLKKYDPYSMVDYFDLEISADEMLELTASEITTLINAIIDTGSYDYIVIDLDSSLHERNRTALLESDQIVLVITNDMQSMLKTNSFFAEEEKLFGKENVIHDKALVIVNKFTDSLVGAQGAANISIDGYLPLIPSWLASKSPSEILGNDDYNQEIQAIIHEKMVNNWEGVT